MRHLFNTTLKKLWSNSCRNISWKFVANPGKISLAIIWEFLLKFSNWLLEKSCKIYLEEFLERNFFNQICELISKEIFWAFTWVLENYREFSLENFRSNIKISFWKKILNYFVRINGEHYLAGIGKGYLHFPLQEFLNFFSKKKSKKTRRYFRRNLCMHS